MPLRGTTGVSAASEGSERASENERKMERERRRASEREREGQQEREGEEKEGRVRLICNKRKRIGDQ